MEEVVPVIAIGGGVFIAMLWIVTSNARRTKDRKQIEESRRELAAYVAEGSMTPDEAARLMEAGARVSEDDE